MHDLNANAGPCLSELELDEWLAGELSASEQQRCAQHLQNCSACTARKQAIEQANRPYLAQAPDFNALSALTGAELLEPNQPRPVRARSSLRWLGAPLLAACAALAFSALRPNVQPSSSELTRSNGAPRLGYYIKRGDKITRGEGVASVQPGDALRFVYSADREYYLAIFSADAHGVGVYFPSGAQAERVAAGQDAALDFSVELDETLGRERVTALFCPEAFNVEQVQSALSSGAALPSALASCQSVGFELNKQRTL
jgi:hypothetical protein